MRKLFKPLVMIAALVITICTSITTASALYVKEAKSGSFSFNAVSETKYTITYYLPNSSDTTYTSFVSNTMEVNSGTNLYTALSSVTTNINNFKFVNWHTSKNHFRNDDATQDVISNSKTVTSNMTVYAKYTRENNLYYYHTVDKKDYYLESSFTDYGLNAREVYFGDRIYSYSGVEGSKYDLRTNSGVYKFTKDDVNKVWTVERKISFGINDVAGWWTSAGAHTHIYVEDSNTSGTGKFIKNITFSNNLYTTYLPYYYNKFVVCRSPSDSTDWGQFWNQTQDALLTQPGAGQTTLYGIEHTTLYVQNNPSEGKKNYNWW